MKDAGGISIFAAQSLTFLWAQLSVMSEMDPGDLVSILSK